MAERMWREGPRLMAERAVPQDGEESRRAGRRVRGVKVNLAESPLGWLKARGMVTDRQFCAGERLRRDWEMAGLGPRVTMAWDAAPLARGRRCAPNAMDPTLVQIDAKRRFNAAVESVGPGLNDIMWRVVCAGEGMSGAEKALGWPARAGKLVLCLALDRLANFYRIG